VEVLDLMSGAAATSSPDARSVAGLVDVARRHDDAEVTSRVYRVLASLLDVGIGSGGDDTDGVVSLAKPVFSDKTALAALLRDAWSGDHVWGEPQSDATSLACLRYTVAQAHVYAAFSPALQAIVTFWRPADAAHRSHLHPELVCRGDDGVHRAWLCPACVVGVSRGPASAPLPRRWRRLRPARPTRGRRRQPVAGGEAARRPHRRLRAPSRPLRRRGRPLGRPGSREALHPLRGGRRGRRSRHHRRRRPAQVPRRPARRAQDPHALPARAGGLRARPCALAALSSAPA